MTREELKWVIYERTLNSVEEPVLDCILELIAAEREAEREAICPIVYGLCVSDNNAQEIVNAIRARGSK
jgi:uncharacterized protein related to proFAR isomerase